MVDDDTPTALCPRCGSQDLVAVTLAYHQITQDGKHKGVFDHNDWGDDFHLQCEACDWSDGTWGLTYHSESDVSLNDLTYATYEEAQELAEIKEEFRQERDGTAP